MSRENVELVRRALTEFGATGRQTEWAAPDFVWDMSALTGWFEEPVYRGREGFRVFFRTWIEPYDDWAADLEEVVDVDDDHVIAVMLQRGRVKGTQSWVEQRNALLYPVRDGKLERARLFDTLDEALAAAR